MSGTRRMLGFVMLGVLVVGAVAQADAISQQRSAQQKLLAYRAARVDAIRKLAERINGLSITSKTTVRDFVTESDTIQTALSSFLNGMKEVGKPRYLDDGTCEVTMQVTLEEVRDILKTIHKQYYKGDKVKVVEIDKMETVNEIKVITVTGNGAPREDLEQDVLIPFEQGGSVYGKLPVGTRKFWATHATAQGRLGAERAARVDAMRRLAERIKGVAIDSRTTVRDFVTEEDDIRAITRAYLVGAREVGVRYHADELIVEVEMAVKLSTLYASLKSWAEVNYKGDKAKVRQLEQLVLTSKDTMLTETGMGTVNPRYLKDVPEPVAAASQLGSGSSVPAWATQTMRVTGQGAVDTDNPNKAQAKLMAFRAAEMDARRKLAEQLNGLAITSSTSVQDFVTESDTIQTAMMTFQQGAHVVDGSQKLLDDGTAEVTVEIDLKPLWSMVIHYRAKGVVTIK